MKENPRGRWLGIEEGFLSARTPFGMTFAEGAPSGAFKRMRVCVCVVRVDILGLLRPQGYGWVYARGALGWDVGRG
jgi:hypothetical protein